MNHQKGKSLNIKSNICGGIELDVNHTPNSLGGRTINVLATKAGAQMFNQMLLSHGLALKPHFHTRMMDNLDEMISGTSDLPLPASTTAPTTPAPRRGSTSTTSTTWTRWCVTWEVRLRRPSPGREF